MFGLIDCETSGLYAAENGLIEFTCAVIDPRTMAEIDRFKSGQIAIVPGSFVVEDSALAVNGYAADTLHLGTPERETALAFADWVRRYGPLTFVSFNGMDWGFIDALFKRHGIAVRGLFSHRRIDLQGFIVARNVMLGTPDSSASLAAVSKEFGVSTLPDHSSDADVSATLDVMRKLFGLVDWSRLVWAPETSADLSGIFAGAETQPVKGLVNEAGEPVDNGLEIVAAILGAAREEKGRELEAEKRAKAEPNA